MSSSDLRSGAARWARVALVAVLVVSMVVAMAGPAAAYVEGKPKFSVTLSDDTVEPGETTTLQLDLLNSGEVEVGASSQTLAGKEQVVTTARGTIVRVDSGNSPLEIKSGEIGLGSVPEGVRPVPVQVSVPEDAEPGTYEIPVEVEYDYTDFIPGGQVNQYDNEHTTKEFTVEVTVEEAPRFEVVESTTDSPIGGSGTVDLTVENVGTAPANDSTLTVQSPNADLRFGGAPTAETFVGDWAPGERRTFSFGASVAAGASERSLSLRPTVAYEDEDGLPQQAQLSAGVTPLAEQRFVATSVETTAATGDTGRLTVSLTNTGDRQLEDAAVSLQSSNAALTFGGSPTAQTVVGNWAPGETKEIAVEAGFSPNAENRTYAVDATITYSGTDGRTAQAKPVTLGVVPADEQSFDIGTVRSTAATGDTGRVTVPLTNTGERTLSDATVTFQSSNAGLTFGGSPTAETFVGDWAPGETRTVSVEAGFAPNAENRTYAVDATVAYTDTGGRDKRADPITLGVQPAPEQSFAIDTTETTAAVGDSGRLTVSLTNTADRDLTDATVTLESSNAGLAFGGSPSARTFVGEWAAGETREFTVEAGFTGSAEERPYAVDATVAYTDDEGNTERADPVTLSVTPADEQSFDLADVNSTLRVGAEGTVSGTVVNTGPGTVENAVLVLEPPGNVDTTETEYALGELAAEDQASFSYDLEVSSSAREGPRQFTYRVRYDDADGDTRTSDPVYVRNTIGASRNTFEVSSNASLNAGSTETIAVDVTNTGDVTVSSVTAKLFANAPISADNDEAFVDQLEPGETTTLTFQVSASGSALAKAYPLSMDFQYDEPDGDTKISDSYQIPVEVTAGGGGGLLSVFPGGTAGLAGIGLGAVLSLGGLAAVGLGLIRRP